MTRPLNMLIGFAIAAALFAAAPQCLVVAKAQPRHAARVVIKIAQAAAPCADRQKA